MVRFNIDSAFNMDFFVYDTSFRAGIRSDNKAHNVNCRKMNGFLYLFSGGVEIIDENKSILVASSNDLVFISKNSSYRLRYKGDARFSLINFNAKYPDGKEAKFFDSISYLIVNDGFDSKIENSLIAEGCVIEGEVKNCIIFRGVKVGKGAKLENCIIMQSGEIGENVSLDYVVADKNVSFKDGITLMGCRSFPMVIGKGLTV